MMEGNKLKGLNLIGLMIPTYDGRKYTKGSKQSRPKVSYM